MTTVLSVSDFYRFRFRTVNVKIYASLRNSVVKTFYLALVKNAFLIGKNRIYKSSVARFLYFLLYAQVDRNNLWPATAQSIRLHKRLEFVR